MHLKPSHCGSNYPARSLQPPLVPFDRNSPCKQVREFVTEHDQKANRVSEGKQLHREIINWRAYLFSEFGMYKLPCCALNFMLSYCLRGAGCVWEVLSDLPKCCRNTSNQKASGLWKAWNRVKMKRHEGWSELGLFTEIELEAEEVQSVIKAHKEKGRAQGIGKVLAKISFHPSNLDACWDEVYLGLP